MKTSIRKTLLALTIGVVMVGCTKAPSTVDPSKNLQPGVGVVNPSTNNPSCGDTVVTPTAPPVVPLVAPLCNFLAFTACIGGYDKLFLYDDILKDNYALPGAGENIHNPQYYDGGKIIFDRCGQIWIYDLVAETVCALSDVNGLGFPVRRASIDWLGDKAVFLDYCGNAFLWCCNPCISVCELPKINTLGFINWASISADGNWIVFTTCDGCLYLYNICTPAVCQININVCATNFRKFDRLCRDEDSCGILSREDWRRVNCCEDVIITQPAISATGRQIVFTAVDRFTGRTALWRYDVLTGCLDPMPFANAALNSLLVADPIFKCYDEEHVYFEALVPNSECCDENGYLHESIRKGHDRLRGNTQVLEYNWLTETVRTLSILNNVVSDLNILISDFVIGCDIHGDCHELCDDRCGDRCKDSLY
jgi:hypothetical protein